MGIAHKPPAQTTPLTGRARGHIYDRSSAVELSAYNGTLAAHNWTTRWTYTVPANRIAFNCLISCFNNGAIATAGRVCRIVFDINTTGSWPSFYYFIHFSTTDLQGIENIPVPFYLIAGDAIRAKTWGDDTINHDFNAVDLAMEFDE